MPYSHILNSFYLIEELSKVTIEVHFELISLDVVSLFINVPLDLTIDGIEERWNLISPNTNIPLHEFILALRMVLNSTYTYFILNGLIYKQTFDTSMDSLLSRLRMSFCSILNLRFTRSPVVIPFNVRYSFGSSFSFFQRTQHTFYGKWLSVSFKL